MCMLKTMYLSKLPWILFCDRNRKFQCPLCILNDCLKHANKSQKNILTLLICSLFWSSILDTIKQILCLDFLTRILNLANIKLLGSHNSLLCVCVCGGVGDCPEHCRMCCQASLASAHQMPVSFLSCDNRKCPQVLPDLP